MGRTDRNSALAEASTHAKSREDAGSVGPASPHHQGVFAALKPVTAKIQKRAARKPPSCLLQSVVIRFRHRPLQLQLAIAVPIQTFHKMSDALVHFRRADDTIPVVIELLERVNHARPG